MAGFTIDWEEARRDDEDLLRKKKRHADLLAGLIPEEEQTDQERAFLGKPKKGFIGPPSPEDEQADVGGDMLPAVPFGPPAPAPLPWWKKPGKWLSERLVKPLEEKLPLLFGEEGALTLPDTRARLRKIVETKPPPETPRERAVREGTAVKPSAFFSQDFPTYGGPDRPTPEEMRKEIEENLGAGVSLGFTGTFPAGMGVMEAVGAANRQTEPFKEELWRQKGEKALPAAIGIDTARILGTIGSFVLPVAMTRFELMEALTEEAVKKGATREAARGAIEEAFAQPKGVPPYAQGRAGAIRREALIKEAGGEIPEVVPRPQLALPAPLGVKTEIPAPEPRIFKEPILESTGPYPPREVGGEIPVRTPEEALALQRQQAHEKLGEWDYETYMATEGKREGTRGLDVEDLMAAHGETPELAAALGDRPDTRGMYLNGLSAGESLFKTNARISEALKRWWENHGDNLLAEGYRLPREWRKYKAFKDLPDSAFTGKKLQRPTDFTQAQIQEDMGRQSGPAWEAAMEEVGPWKTTEKGTVQILPPDPNQYALANKGTARLSFVPPEAPIAPPQRHITAGELTSIQQPTPYLTEELRNRLREIRDRFQKAPAPPKAAAPKPPAPLPAQPPVKPYEFGETPLEAGVSEGLLGPGEYTGGVYAERIPDGGGQIFKHPAVLDESYIIDQLPDGQWRGNRRVVEFPAASRQNKLGSRKFNPVATETTVYEGSDYAAAKQEVERLLNEKAGAGIPPPPGKPPAPVATKEPWQMTRAEAENYWEGVGGGKHVDPAEHGGMGFVPGTTPAGAFPMSKASYESAFDWFSRESKAGHSLASSDLYHRAAVENALSQGKPVPPEVLSEYPDLAKAGRTVPRETPTTVTQGDLLGQAPPAGQMDLFSVGSPPERRVQPSAARPTWEMGRRPAPKGPAPTLEIREPETVTLYRVGSPPAATLKKMQSTGPEWLQSQMALKENQGGRGQWFADSLEELEWYRQDRFPNAPIYKIQVTPEEAERFRVSNLPKEHPAKIYSRRPENEFFLPAEIADQATESLPSSPGFIREPEAPYGQPLPEVRQEVLVEDQGHTFAFKVSSVKDGVPYIRITPNSPTEIPLTKWTVKEGMAAPETPLSFPKSSDLTFAQKAHDLPPGPEAPPPPPVDPIIAQAEEEFRGRATSPTIEERPRLWERLKRTFLQKQATVEGYGKTAKAGQEAAILAKDRTNMRIAEAKDEYELATKDLRPAEKDNLVDVLDTRDAPVDERVIPINRKVATAARSLADRLEAIGQEKKAVGYLSKNPEYDKLIGQKNVLEDKIAREGETPDVKRALDSVTETLKNTEARVPFEPRKSYFPHSFYSGYSLSDLGRIMAQGGKAKERLLADLVKNEYAADIAGAEARMLNHLAEARAEAMGAPPVAARAKVSARGGDPRYQRTPEQPPGWERNPDVALPEYYEKAYRQLETTKAFGADDTLLRQMEKQISLEIGAERAKFVIDSIKQQIGRSGLTEGLADDPLGVLRSLNVPPSMLWSPISNAGQRVNTILRQGLKAFLHGAKLSATPEGRRFAKLAGVFEDLQRGTERMADVGGSNKARALAGKFLKQAFTPVEGGNRAGSVLSTPYTLSNILTKYSKAMAEGNAKNMERWAAELGDYGLDIEEVMTRQISPMSAYSSDAQKVIEGLPQVRRLTEEEIKLAGSRSARVEQFTGETQEIPPIMDSSLGKTTGQFAGFGIRQTGLVVNTVLTQAKRGNYQPLLILATVYPAVGEVIADTYSLVTGRPRPTELKARYLDNLMAVGGVGIIQKVIEDFFLSENMGATGWGAALGSVGEKASRLGHAVVKPIKKIVEGEDLKAEDFHRLAKATLGVTPVGQLPKRIFYPNEKSPYYEGKKKREGQETTWETGKRLLGQSPKYPGGFPALEYDIDQSVKKLRELQKKYEGASASRQQDLDREGATLQEKLDRLRELLDQEAEKFPEEAAALKKIKEKARTRKRVYYR